MQGFIHNQQAFVVEPAGAAWNVVRIDRNGVRAIVGAHLFEGAAAAAADERARQLVARVFPVGVRIVPPAVSRPQAAGALKIVAPDVARPVFVGWQADSTSFAGVRNGSQE